MAIFSRPLEDLYAIVGGYDPESDKVLLKIMINPLVQMVWLGGIILILGTLVALLPSRAESKAKEMTV